MGKTPIRVGLIYDSDIVVSDEQLLQAQVALATFCGQFLSRFYNLTHIAVAWTRGVSGEVGLTLELYLEAINPGATFGKQYRFAKEVVWDQRNLEIRALFGGEVSGEKIPTYPSASLTSSFKVDSFVDGLVKLFEVMLDMSDAFEQDPDAVLEGPPSAPPAVN